jgi:hypothetical protein
MTLRHLLLRIFILPAQCGVSVAVLGELDFDIAERVLQLLVLNLGQTEHLTTFFLCAFVSLHS